MPSLTPAFQHQHFIALKTALTCVTQLQPRFIKLLVNFQHFKTQTEVTDSYETVIHELVMHREQQGMSQEALAYKIGCAKSLIHKWEQYKRVPSGFLFTCWLDALGLQIKVYKKKNKQRR